MPELIAIANAPWVRAVDATPAVQTEHCADVHKGDSRRIRAKNILESLLIMQHLQCKYTKLRNCNKEKSLNRQLRL